MNRLVRSLADFCLAHPLAEKWLLAPDRRTGHAWLVSVAAAGVPAANVRVTTLRAAAAEFAEKELSRQGLEKIGRTGIEFLVGRALAGLAGREKSYLFSLEPTYELIRRFADTVEELRLAGVGPDSLRDGAFEVTAKARELRQLLNACQALLAGRYADHAGILGLAAKALAGSELFTRRDLYALLPEDTELAPLEENFLAAFPQGRVVRLEVDRPGSPPSADSAADTRFPGRRLECPAAMRIFRAVGEAGEVREAFRRILEEGYRLDEVELVHTDRQAYVPLIVELLQAALPGSPLGPEALPVSFAEGLPAGLSRPGRALAGWLAWIEADCPQAGLVRLLEEGLIRVDGLDEERFGYPYLADLLRRPAVGLGIGRYREGLRRWLASLERRRSTSGPADDAETSLRPVADKEIEAARLLCSTIESLAAIHPPGLAADTGRHLTCVRAFVDRFTRRLTEFDEYARRALLDELDELMGWVGREGPPQFDLTGCLAALADRVPVMGSGPQPGKLHVCPIQSGGHSGRPLTFVVGLDDGRYPGVRSPDPLLLDSERERLSTGLVTSHQKLARKLEAFDRLVARLRGSAVFSWPSVDPVEEREVFPGAVLLPLYRRISGDAEADLAKMIGNLGQPASFAPELPDRALAETEWWLAALCAGTPDPRLAAAVGARYPHLARGGLAEAGRDSGEFTPWDGFVARLDLEHDPLTGEGPVLSGSGLQDLGACPLRYFYRYLLDLEPPLDPEVDHSLWLDPAASGSLLHELFHDFLTGLAALGEPPEYGGRHWERLKALLEGLAADYLKQFPSAGEGPFRRRMRMLEDTARVFLAEEAENYPRRRPAWLEASVGLPPAEHPTAVDSPEPLAVPLPDGAVVRLRGRIDRIDRENDAPESYSVTDYKTGSSSTYELKKPFDCGRRMQPLVYLELAARRIAQIVGPAARVTGFSYFFPGVRDRGLRLTWERDRLQEGYRILEKLVRLASSGAFPSTDNADRDCRFCDFRMLCGSDLAQMAGNCRRKLENQANQVLAPFRELRSRE
ncbi:MAG: PD-(D/E)XK nuclease family protein [Candidatus Glassbacteria bacterium]